MARSCDLDASDGPTRPPSIPGDAEAFLLALDGLLTEPKVAALERRLRILAGRFVPAKGSGRGGERR